MVMTELWDKMGQSKEQQKETFDKVAKSLPVGFVANGTDVSKRRLVMHIVFALNANVYEDCRSISVLCKLK